MLPTKGWADGESNPQWGSLWRSFQRIPSLVPEKLVARKRIELFLSGCRPDAYDQFANKLQKSTVVIMNPENQGTRANHYPQDVAHCPYQCHPLVEC
jgi:hypothetical protein